jgi:Domain of unknown function (DUF4337)
VEEDLDVREVQEKLEQLEGFETGWSRYLALSTALIAVAAAIASLQSGDLANRALLSKSEATLLQSRASDEWSYYQAKSIKAHLAELDERQAQSDSARKRSADYERELVEIKRRGDDLQRQVEAANVKADRLFESHHDLALSVTMFQIAIAMSALSALLRRKSFWILSIGMSVVGLGLLIGTTLST